MRIFSITENLCNFGLKIYEEISTNFWGNIFFLKCVRIMIYISYVCVSVFVVTIKSLTLVLRALRLEKALCYLNML